VTILARYAGWGYRKPRFYGIIDTVCGHAGRGWCFHDHTLDRAVDGFTFRQSQA